MDIIILTGMSGAGKSQAAAYFEDHGYFCIDNLPPMLLPGIVESFMGKEEAGIPALDKLCVVVDVRSRSMLAGFDSAMVKLDDMDCKYRIVFLEANDNVLVSRYRQTRRSHPLMQEMSLVDAIAAERRLLQGIRGRATNIIDTTMTTLSALRKELHTVLDEAEEAGLSIYVESFGFMYGLSSDSDDVIDVRFLPNPFWVEKLQMMSGKDEPIAEYLMGFEETRVFLDKLSDMFKYMIPFIIREGKARLNIGIGCTGGRHRSVFIAEKLGQMLADEGYRVTVHHRDIDRDPRYDVKKPETTG